MKVVLSGRASNDLESIGDYIAKDSPRQALRLTAELRQATTRLGDHPLAYPLQPNIEPNIRRAVVGAYLIFYTVTDTVRVERILHSGRDLSAGMPDR